MSDFSGQQLDPPVLDHKHQRMPGGQRIRLLVVASHPIQYQAPLYRLLAASKVVDLRVLFLSDFGVAPSFDPGFGQSLSFDVPLTDGYEHRFLSTGFTEQPGRGLVPPLGFWANLSPRRCDVILVHGYVSFAVWGACVAAKVKGTPYMLRVETRWETDVRRPPSRRWAKQQVLRPLLRGAGACLAIGSSNRHFYQSYGVPDGRIVMAPYSVDTNRFDLEGAVGRSERTKMLASIGLDPSLPTLCFAAKLQPHKRPLDVLAALDRMRTTANLIMIGEGPLSSEVSDAARVNSRVRRLGFVNQSAIGRWFGASDIVVLPSEAEPWGLVINEAMAAGAVPVVSSAVGCGPDLAQGAGAVYPVGDVSSLADALDRLVADPEALAEARRRSRVNSERHALAVTAGGYEAAAALACGIGTDA